MFELPGGVKREEWFQESGRYAFAVWQERGKWLYRIVPERELKDEIVVAAVIRYHHATCGDIVGEWYDYFGKDELIVWRYGFADTPRTQRQTAIRFDDGSWWAVSPFSPPHDVYGPEEFHFCIVKPPPAMIVRIAVVNVVDGKTVFSRDIGQ